MEEAMNFNKFEKSIMNFDHFKSLTMLFRLMELCFGLLCLAWSSTRLPLLVQIFREYFRLMVSFIISPLFIFLLSNFIVLTLLFKSGRLSGQSPISCGAEDTKIYDSLIGNNVEPMKIVGNSDSVRERPAEISHEAVTEPAEISHQAVTEPAEITHQVVSEMSALEGSGRTDFEPGIVPRRTRWEVVRVDESGGENCGKLQRTATEKCRKVTNHRNAPVETAVDVDNLSNEEFQRAIEAFIAKQIKLHQEEKLDIVLQYL